MAKDKTKNDLSYLQQTNYSQYSIKVTVSSRDKNFNMLSVKNVKLQDKNRMINYDANKRFHVGQITGHWIEVVGYNISFWQKKEKEEKRWRYHTNLGFFFWHNLEDRIWSNQFWRSCLHGYDTTILSYPLVIEQIIDI